MHYHFMNRVAELLCENPTNYLEGIYGEDMAVVWDETRHRRTVLLMTYDLNVVEMHSKPIPRVHENTLVYANWEQMLEENPHLGEPIQLKKGTVEYQAWLEQGGMEDGPDAG